MQILVRYEMEERYEFIEISFEMDRDVVAVVLLHLLCASEACGVPVQLRRH
jgi:hypothetical protein